MASQENLPNIQRRTYIDSSQALKRRKHSHRHSIKPLYPWNQNQAKSPPRKLQTSVFDEYRCKDSQQNISKLNPTTHKKHTPQLSGILPKFTRMVQHMHVISVVYHTNKVKNHMIISINTEKAFDKIQYPFMIKTHIKVGKEVTYHNITKAT